jgi:membrane protease YdiL (CAAX protease family)
LAELAVLAAFMALTTFSMLWIGRPLLSSGNFARVATPLRALAVCLFAAWLLWRRGDRLASVGLAAPASIRRVVVLVVLGYLAIVAANAVLVIFVFPALGLTLPNFEALGVLKGRPMALVYWLAFTWTAAAVGEEFLFRGFVRLRLEQLFGDTAVGASTALLGQAVLFGLLHLYQGLPGLIVTTIAGAVLGVVFLAGRRNLVACIVLHGVMDTVSLTLLFLHGSPAALAK